MVGELQTTYRLGESEAAVATDLANLAVSHNASGGFYATPTVPGGLSRAINGSAADMTAAERRAHHLAKGIPDNQIGPSGYPKVHVVEKATLKEAEEAARNAGGSKPMKHTQDRGQPTHFHAVDQQGKKLGGKDNVHYQKRGDPANPK
jgi:hypothetical protein